MNNNDTCHIGDHINLLLQIPAHPTPPHPTTTYFILIPNWYYIDRELGRLFRQKHWH